MVQAMQILLFAVTASAVIALPTPNVIYAGNVDMIQHRKRGEDKKIDNLHDLANQARRRKLAILEPADFIAPGPIHSAQNVIKNPLGKDVKGSSPGYWLKFVKSPLKELPPPRVVEKWGEDN